MSMQPSLHLNEIVRAPLTDSVWGDGFEDLSLTTLWYPCSWDEVSQDELILYLPSLAHEAAQLSASRIVNERAIAHLSDALCARLFHSLSRFTGDARHSGEMPASIVSSFVAALEELFRTHLGGILNFPAALRHGEEIYRDWFAAPRATWGQQLRRWRLPRHEAEDERYALIQLELLVLETMVAILAAARRGSVDRHIDGIGCDALGLPARPAGTRDLLAALHTGCNPAYVFPELQCHHHLFTAAGWLGWVNRGRKAYLPVFIAEYLVDLLEPRHSERPVTDALLTYYAHRIGGPNYLLKAARRVVERGYASLLNPQRLMWREDVWQVIGLMAELAKSEASDGRLPSFEGSQRPVSSPASFLSRRI